MKFLFGYYVIYLSMNGAVISSFLQHTMEEPRKVLGAQYKGRCKDKAQEVNFLALSLSFMLSAKHTNILKSFV